MNARFAELADKGPLEGILRYSDEPLVSTDIIGSSYSSIFDTELTMATRTGQGLLLVRQRVGLQLPDGRPSPEVAVKEANGEPWVPPC